MRKGHQNSPEDERNATFRSHAGEQSRSERLGVQQGARKACPQHQSREVGSNAETEPGYKLTLLPPLFATGTLRLRRPPAQTRIGILGLGSLSSGPAGRSFDGLHYRLRIDAASTGRHIVLYMHCLVAT